MQPGFHLPFLLWATALLAACGPLPQGESGLDYLTNSNPSCWQPDAERLAAVTELSRELDAEIARGCGR